MALQALDLAVISYIDSILAVTFSNTIGSNNQRARWVVINHNAGATFEMSSISTAPGVGTLAALGDQRAGPPVRTTSAIGQHFRVSYSQPRTVNVTAIIGSQITPGASVHLTSANTSTFAGEQIRAMLVVTNSSTPVIHTYLNTPVAARYWGLYVSDEDNPDGFIEIGEWVNGQYEEWVHNPGFPLAEQTYARTTTHESEGGVVWSYFHADQREVSLNFDLLFPEMRQQLQRGLSHVHYSHQPLLLHINPTDPTDRMLYLRMLDRLGISKSSGQLYQGQTLTFREEMMPRRS